MANDPGPPAGAAVCQAPGCDRQALLLCDRCLGAFCPRHTRLPAAGPGFVCGRCPGAPRALVRRTQQTAAGRPNATVDGAGGGPSKRKAPGTDQVQ
jgi:hypothetical protein